jgi:hypothetical protein
MMKIAAASGLTAASDLRTIVQDRAVMHGNDARARRTWDGTLLPYTGKEFLDSLEDGREVWIYGERVRNMQRASRVSQYRAHAGAAI